MLGNDPAKVRKASPIKCELDCESINDLRSSYPKSRPKPSSTSNTFEIALVLAGAVSAGAYTAGVMDFLFEALDEWYKHRSGPENGDKLPNHNVKLRVISGASAGSINGAIAAVACRYEFTPVTLNNPQQKNSPNPFYDTWVEKIDIRRLLSTSDVVANSPVTSLLNSKSLKELAFDMVDRKWGKPKTRCWLADPFKLLLTVTNLRDVPYTVRFTGPTGLDHEMVMHRDHVGFSVPASLTSKPSLKPPPDILPLHPANSKTKPGWCPLAYAALASGAFPVALAAISLSRPGSDYDYRFVYPHVSPVVFAKPRIHRNKPYTFTAVDGGTMNNEPFELARVELAGMMDHNPRKGKKACRAVIMIDPFTDPRQDTEPKGSLWATFLALLKALKSQSRFKQIDLTLAEAGDVYSRFMIAPSRRNKGRCRVRGSKALASSGLEGFLGFFSRDYRHHDYMLGRRNCQRFLQEHFVLPSSNALFKSGTKKQHHQIIPLVGTAKQPQNQPPWPAYKFGGYDVVEQDIKDRIDALYRPLAKEVGNAPFLSSSWLARGVAHVLLWVGKGWLKKKVRRTIRNWINDACNEVNRRA